MSNKKSTATINACKLCVPLGACVAFRGIEGAMPFLHGSQGCATYIRRYIISHFREPMDIASSSFSEETAIFGGRENLKAGLKNVCLQYKPQFIGIATTCLAETIGEDIELSLRELKEERSVPEDVKIVTVSTPSFNGTHIEGFRAAVKAVTATLAKTGKKEGQINIFPAFLSPSDLRHIKEILEDFGLKYVMLPDYSETLDSGIWSEYLKIPEGGTSIEAIASMGGSAASIEFTRTAVDEESAGSLLFEDFKVPHLKMGIPLGIKQTDLFFEALEKLSGRPTPSKYLDERGRLIDAYVDAHKYTFDKRAVVYGEEDLVIAIASFLAEIGIIPVLCASGGKSGRLKSALKEVIPDICDNVVVSDGSDFMEIAQEAERLKPNLFIGNSKGYSVARRLGVPLVRAGFPIHDRIGAGRILHIGYRGTQQLFDRVVNALLWKRQEESPVGYGYL